MTLTTEHLNTLRRPFTPAAVKFRLDAKKAFDNKVRCVCYIDASLAADRIELVDPAWKSSLTRLGPALDASPMLCSLTILGAKREQVGQYVKLEADDKHVKSAASDAFKRAAAEFGVGKYLRVLGQFTVSLGEVKVGEDKKFKYIQYGGIRQLRQQYAKYIADMEVVARFGEPIDHGDFVRDENDDAGVQTSAMDEAAEMPGLDDDMTAVLEAIAGACGHPLDREGKLAEDFERHVDAFLKYAVDRAKAIPTEVRDELRAAALAKDVDAVQSLTTTGAPV